MSTPVIQAVRRSAVNITHLPSRRVLLASSRRTSTLSSSSSRFLSTRTFPCVERNAEREARIISSSESGPEPSYARPPSSSYSLYHHKDPFPLVYTPHQPLPEFTIAYESWGNLNAAKDNAILLHTGLSASSHAASTAANPAPGWWEEFIGPGRALDTDKYFIICTNVLGGCYGSTGPSSIDPLGENGERYGTRFPILSIFDMVRAQFHLLDHLGIDTLAASTGSSMGAMQSLAAAWLFPDRVSKLVSISGTARSTPASIATRFAQRSVLMADPNWNNGFYYDGIPPHTGMKLARQIATISYRSGPEWDIRFGRKFQQLTPDPTRPDGPREPALCPDFQIETYLDHQGEQFCLKYDANSLIYISKAMDLFDMTYEALQELRLTPTYTSSPSKRTLLPPRRMHPAPHAPPPHLTSLARGLEPLSKTPTLILGVQSDILFPSEQQKEIADALRMAGNVDVRHYELGGVWGHDTFLLDVKNVGGAIRGFLS